MKKLTALFLAAVLMFCAAGCGERKSPEIIPETSVHIEESTQPSRPSEPVPSAPETTAPPETTHPAPALPPQPEPRDEDFVWVGQYIPDMEVELKYASSDNFTGNPIYEFDCAFLRYGTVKKLMAVQAELREFGLGLKLWDGFRPVAAQYALWEICPDPVYVADPRTGHSSHSRGNTVDVTLVDAQGREVAMPTGFDDFSALADRNFADCPEAVAQNAALLQQVMEENGFTGYYNEWWHFSDRDSYAVEDVFTPIAAEERYALCQEYITLRTAPDTAAQEIVRIPAGDSFTVLAVFHDFYYVNYCGLYGYVLASYTAPFGA